MRRLKKNKIILISSTIKIISFIEYTLVLIEKVANLFLNKEKKSFIDLVKDDKEISRPKERSYPSSTESEPLNNYLYHFTHPNNISSIKKYGILSWRELLRKNINHTPASNDLSRKLDSRCNLEDYVRLSLKQDHPMYHRVLSERRVDRLVWLKIDPKVMNLPDTLFSDDNATSNRAIINKNKNTALKSYSAQAEVLVKRCIKPRYIYFS